MVATLLSALLRCSAAGELTLGAGSTTPGIPTAGEEFSVSIYGENFDPLNDKIIFSPYGASCGTAGPPRGAPDTIAEYAALSGGGTAGNLRLEGLKVYLPGTWRMCVCDYDHIPDGTTLAPIDVSNGTTTTITTTTTTTQAQPGCDSLERYTFMHSGYFSFYGPDFKSLTGADAWTAGVESTLRIRGDGLNVVDRIRIVGSSVSCWDPTASKAMHPAVSSGFGFDISGPRLTLQSNSNNDYWDHVIINEPGEYTVCWCGVAPCDSDAAFVVRAAVIEVVGPANVEQPQACTTGVLCTVSFTGTGFSPAAEPGRDRIRIINSGRECGTVGQTSGVVQGADGPRTSGSETESNFGGIIMGRSGEFTVCWCGAISDTSPSGCDSDEAFNVRIGDLTVGGPQQGNNAYAPLGARFDYTIEGWGMSDVDRISIIDDSLNCAEQGAAAMSEFIWPGNSPANRPPQITGGPSATNRTHVTWTNIVLTRMQAYKVCWCAHNNNGCTADSDYAMYLGLIIVQGPTNDTIVYEVPGRPFAFTVNAPLHQSTLSVDDRIRIVSVDVSRGVCGGSGTGTHAIAVSPESCYPNCVPTAVNGGPVLSNSNQTESWHPVVLTMQGTYDVCWCNNGEGGCNSDNDFKVQVGRIVMSGVSTGATWHCMAGMECYVRVPLQGGTSEDDQIQILESGLGHTCGLTGRADASLFSRGTRIQGRRVLAPGGGQEVEFMLGQPRQPGIYQVCYCQGTQCLSPNLPDLDFLQKAGEIRVSGLDGQSDVRICYLRSTCDLSIRGNGLRGEDSLMVIDISDQCGHGVNPASAGFQGEGFMTLGGDRAYIGEYLGMSDTGLESWDYPLGTPRIVGRYRLCYCSQTRSPTGTCTEREHFDLPAGQLFVRGTDYEMDTRCDQGESCQIMVRGRSFSDSDRILLFPKTSNRTCGSPEADAYAQWMYPQTPVTIVPDVIIQNLYVATFLVNNVVAPGSFRVCYCSEIVGSRKCAEPGAQGAQAPPPVDPTLYAHQVGEVDVVGAIMEVEPILEDPYGTESPLPAAPYAASVRVNVFMAGVSVTCAATGVSAPTGFVPQKSDVMNCTEDPLILSDRQRLFPRCWGIGSTVEPVSNPGWAQVHIPLVMTAEAAEQTSELHIWCYSSQMCSNERCVMPADSTGKVVSLTRGLITHNGVWSTAVATESTIRVRLASDFPLGVAWPRIKVVRSWEDCTFATLTPGVSGLTCGQSSMSKCDPAPRAYVSQSWGDNRELVWDGITVPRAGDYNVCYCDRHSGLACTLWQQIGVLSASGPMYAGQARYWGNPDVPFEIDVEGVGLTGSDRIRVIPEAWQCVEELSTGPANGTGGARLLQASAFQWRSGAPTFVNGTNQRWSTQIADMGVYKVCWCGGDTRSCTLTEDFTVELGQIVVDVRRDCELTDWWPVGGCSRNCGGGSISLRRAIQRDASGGGDPCPGAEGLQRTEACNMEPCALARVDSIRTEPAVIHEGTPFVVFVEGNSFEPSEDRILVVSAEIECGSSQVHFGGAHCEHENSYENQLLCGNGRTSVRITRPGDYRICLCDASSASAESWDGTRNVSVGAFEAVGVVGQGCANAANYLIGAGVGGLIEVLPAPTGDAAEEEGPLSTGMIVVITGVVALFCVMACGISGYMIVVWHNRKQQDNELSKNALKGDAEMQMQQGEVPLALPPPETDKEGMLSLPAPEQQGGMDMQALAWYEAYYQHLGYPPGTATQAFGGQFQQQLALPAPAALSPPPPQQPNPGDYQNRWLALQNAPTPPPARPQPLPMQTPQQPPPTPPMLRSSSSRSPRKATQELKSFGDLVKEAEKKPAAPSFTNMDLSPMPTPTHTPRGGPDEAQDSSNALAIEDGSMMNNSNGFSQRPDTADSNMSDMSLALSESTAGGQSRPGSGNKDFASPAVGTDSSLTDSVLNETFHQPSQEGLAPVKEESESDSAPTTPGAATPPNRTPRKLSSFLNNRLGKLLKSGSSDQLTEVKTSSDFADTFGKSELSKAGEPEEPAEAPLPGTLNPHDEKDSEVESACFGGVFRPPMPPQPSAGDAPSSGGLAAAVEALGKVPAPPVPPEAPPPPATEPPMPPEPDEAAAARKAEEERIAAEEAEAARKAEEERIAAEKAEAVRKAEEERIAAEKAEAARKADEERIAAEKAEAARKAEEERIAAEKAEAARKAEEERIAAENSRKAEQDRIIAENARRAEEARIMAEQAEAARKAEEERIAAEEAEAAHWAEEEQDPEAIRRAEEERIAAEEAEAARKAEEDHQAAKTLAPPPSQSLRGKLAPISLKPLGRLLQGAQAAPTAEPKAAPAAPTDAGDEVLAREAAMWAENAGEAAPVPPPPDGRPPGKAAQPGPSLPPEPPGGWDPAAAPDKKSLRSLAQAGPTHRHEGDDQDEAAAAAATSAAAPVPPPPPGKPLKGSKAPGPTLDLDVDFESSNLSQLSLGRAPGTPTLKNLADLTATKNVPVSPMGTSSGMEDELAQHSQEDVPPPPLGRPPRGPGPMLAPGSVAPGPALAMDMDLESSCLSTYSNFSGTGGSDAPRKKTTLGGLARSSHAATLVHTGAGAPPSPTAASRSKPKRAVIQTRQAGAFDRPPDQASMPPPPPMMPPSPTAAGRSVSPTAAGRSVSPTAAGRSVSPSAAASRLLHGKP